MATSRRQLLVLFWRKKVRLHSFCCEIVNWKPKDVLSIPRPSLCRLCFRYRIHLLPKTCHQNALAHIRADRFDVHSDCQCLGTQWKVKRLWTIFIVAAYFWFYCQEFCSLQWIPLSEFIWILIRMTCSDSHKSRTNKVVNFAWKSGFI